MRHFRTKTAETTIARVPSSQRASERARARTTRRSRARPHDGDAIVLHARGSRARGHRARRGERPRRQSRADRLPGRPRLLRRDAVGLGGRRHRDALRGGAFEPALALADRRGLRDLRGRLGPRPRSGRDRDGAGIRNSQSRGIAAARPGSLEAGREPALLDQADGRAHRRCDLRHARPAPRGRVRMAGRARVVRAAPGRARHGDRRRAKGLGHGSPAGCRRALLGAAQRRAGVAARAAALDRVHLVPLLRRAALAHGLPRDLPGGRHSS